MSGSGHFTRAVVFTLDPTPAQDRLLRSYCGAARFAHNWAISQVKTNLAGRAAERQAGVPEDKLTPSVSWSKFGLSTAWNQSKREVAPWWREVSMHAFRSGVESAAAGLDNWSKSKDGTRGGRRVGFPGFKSRAKATLSVSFTEINHQLSWLHPSRHGVRLMLPQSTPDPTVKRRRAELGWVHVIESTRRLYRLVETGRASIQKVTISLRGGRWRVSFLVRYTEQPVRRPVARPGGPIGVDVGVKHLATLSRPVKGLTDEIGHIENPRCLEVQLRRLARLDRQLARCVPGSKNRAKAKARRARLHGRIAKTRALHLHRVTNALAAGFDIVAIEDLNIAGMSTRKRHLGRALADASLGELRRQLTYKTADRGATLVAVGRFYPSSKTCSECGAVKAKLSLSDRTFSCDACTTTIDRDINAAVNIEREALRLLEARQVVAGLRPETRNAAPRPQKTDLPEGAGGRGRLKAEPSSPHQHQLVGA